MHTVYGVQCHVLPQLVIFWTKKSVLTLALSIDALHESGVNLFQCWQNAFSEFISLQLHTYLSTPSKQTEDFQMSMTPYEAQQTQLPLLIMMQMWSSCFTSASVGAPVH